MKTIGKRLLLLILLMFAAFAAFYAAPLYAQEVDNTSVEQTTNTETQSENPVPPQGESYDTPLSEGEGNGEQATQLPDAGQNSSDISGAEYNLSSLSIQSSLASIPGRYYDDSVEIQLCNTAAVTKNYNYFYVENPQQDIMLIYYLGSYPLPYEPRFTLYKENQEEWFWDGSLLDAGWAQTVTLKEGLNRFSVKDDMEYFSIYFNIVYIPPTANAQRRGEIMQAVIDANNQSVDEDSFLAAENGINAQLAIPYDNFEDKISLSGIETPLSMDKYYNIVFTVQDSVQLGVEVNGAAEIYIDGSLAQSLNRSKTTIPLNLSKYFTKINVNYETTGKNYQICVVKLPSSLDSDIYQTISNKVVAENAQCVDQASYDQSIADMESFLDQTIADIKIINITGLAGYQNSQQPYQIYLTEQANLYVSTFSKEPAAIIFNGVDTGTLSNTWKAANLNLNSEGNTLEIRFGSEIYKIYIFALLSQVKPEIKTALYLAAAESNASLPDEAACQQALDKMAIIYRCNQEGKVRKLAAGYSHYLALLEDGTVVAWNQNGNLLDVPATVNSIKDIGAGDDYSIALKEDGTVVAWGSNMAGTLNIPAGLNNVQAISVGPNFCLALKNDGTVAGWGSNPYGVLNIPAGLSQVKAISAGRYHALALKENGTVIGWGSNDYGETSIPAELTNIQAVSAGDYLSLLLKADGSVAIIDRNYQSYYPVYLTGIKHTFCGDEYTNYAISTDGSVKKFSQGALYNNSEIVSLAGNGKKARQIVASRNYYEDALILMEDGTVFSPNNKYPSILASFIKKHASIGSTAISKSHSIYYFENPNQTLTVNSDSDCQVSFNGQLLKSFTNATEVLPLVLIPGKNELEISYSGGILDYTRKVAVFYLPQEANALFRQAVLNQVIAADAASVDQNSYNSGINNIMSIRALSLPELGSTVEKPYAIKLSTTGQVNLSFAMLAGSLAVSVNGTSAGTSNALYGNIPFSLNPGPNEVIVQYTNGATQTYKMCLFYLPSESSPSLQQTLAAAIAAANSRTVDETTYQQESAGIALAKNLIINNTALDLNRNFHILYTENNIMNMGVTTYTNAKVLQDFVEIKSFTRDHQEITLNLHNGVNNLEVQFGEGAFQTVYKICVFYLPASAESGFRTNISAAVTAAQQKNFDQNSYNLEIKGIIQRNKYIAFTNFIGNLDMNRKYRILYTEEPQLVIQCSTAERADISMVKVSNGSDVAGTENYVVVAATGNFTVPLVEGRNVLQISFTEFGEVTTYCYGIFRGSSQFGRITKNKIIDAVVNADSTLNNDNLTYQINLMDVTNTYFRNLNSNWFKWL
ncbi:MAG: hypothetical protein ABFC94_03875 [Syntrophomonas sp.]